MNGFIIRLVGLCAIVLLTTVGCVSSGSDESSTISTFSKSYGGPLHDDASVVLNTEDGGFVLIGSAEGDDLGNASSLQPGLGSPRGGDFWLQKLDANGNVEVNRMIGVRSPYTPGTVWKRARPTPDGGVILTGEHAITREVPRPAGATGPTQTVVTIGMDVAAAKLDANGDLVWRVNHDSGAWLNYDYFQTNGDLANARDSGLDVWPMADGGYLVVGSSIANLEDRLSIGFPCEDEALNAITDDPPCEDATPGSGSNRFMHAISIVVLRLNADGSLRWQRRLTDNAYDINGNLTVRDFGLGVLIRATADGGAVLARPVAGGTLVHRLLADGSPLWRTVLGDIEVPAGLIQTDDAVDGPDGDLQDGQRDDGFALAGNDRVIQLDANGAVKWNTNLAPDPVVGGSDDVFINDLTQLCDYGRPTRCDVIAVGRSNKEDDQ